MDSSDDEKPRKIPFAMLKKLQADGSSAQAPIKQKIQKKLTPQQKALQNAIESTQKKASKSKTKPTEVSNSAPVMPDRPQDAHTGPKKEKARDPRFTETAGKLDPRMFKAAYSFVEDIRKEEKQKLQKLVNDSKASQKQKEAAQMELERMKTTENQNRRAELEAKTKAKLLKEEREKVAKGKTPFFFTKTALAKEVETKRFMDVAARGNVDNLIAKKRKRMDMKEKMNMPKRRKAIDE